MADYIRRDGAMFALRKAERGGSMTALTRLERAYAEIREMPAADVAEVHHARWEEADWREYDAQSGETIRFPKAAIVCSDCRNAFKKGTLRIQSFCPACGAKMDGAAE
jgi:hypothetical protein